MPQSQPMIPLRYTHRGILVGSRLLGDCADILRVASVQLSTCKALVETDRGIGILCRCGVSIVGSGHISSVVHQHRRDSATKGMPTHMVVVSVMVCVSKEVLVPSMVVV